MRTLRDLVEDIIKLPNTDLQLVADSLAAYSPATAEHLKNYIGFAQQEWDALENQEKQYEQMSRAADEAYLDYAYNDLER